MPPKTFLMVTIQNGTVSESITKAELTHAVSTGIRWGALGGDMVPLFEEHCARLERNFTIEQWVTLDAMERAIIIAQRRIEISIKNVQSEAEMRAAKRRQKN